MKNFKLIMKSLINNDACIEGGKTKKWYLAIVFIFLSLILSILPVMVTSLQANGSDFTNLTYLYNYDNAIVAFSDHLVDADLSMIVEKDGENHILNADLTVWNTVHNGVDNVFNQYIHLNNKDEVDFEVYYTDKTGDDFIAYYTNVTQNKNPLDGTPRAVPAERSTSYLIFGKEKMVGQIFQPGNTVALSAVSGDYLNLEVGADLKSLATVEMGGVSYITSHDALFSETGGGLKAEAYRVEVIKKWNNLYDDIYYNTKMTTALQSTLIMLGVNALLVFFMGLMVFILTRGKRNPFRIYTFWETQKIAYWASFAPALLSLILGFIFPQYAVMIFVMLIGIRIMWMSMKSLKPAM